MPRTETRTWTRGSRPELLSEEADGEDRGFLRTTRRMMLMRIEGSTNYPKDDEKEAMLCGCVMLVCTLVRPVVSACEWRGMLADTLVYQPGSRSRGIWWVRAWVQDWWTQVGSYPVLPRRFQDGLAQCNQPVW